ncbi:M15 family metallopeptidase [Amycolatopsis palatopharyngis]|uniref:M15 family metallopeptidase n=1 Tax=Amycolatopsis palatopharyngis TaxID=187982 RepID=UPI001B85C546|nr:M15 family metallopeptidase [Amycolatopsis palatopharyngis]
MATSQNGWPVNPSRTYRQVPGSTVHITVADGVAGDVLMHVAREFDQRVEDIDWRSTRGEFDDWGWANRPIRGSNETSNHASATAMDLNATRHPLGARGTFTAAQVAEIRKILAEVDGTVRWGGDYTGRADEMHFEINASYARVKAVADGLTRTGGGGAAPGRDDVMTPEQEKRILAAIADVPRRTWKHMIYNHMLKRKEWAQTSLGAIQDRTVRQQIAPLRALLSGMAETLKQFAGGHKLDLDAIEAASERGASAALDAEDLIDEAELADELAPTLAEMLPRIPDDQMAQLVEQIPEATRRALADALTKEGSAA